MCRSLGGVGVGGEERLELADQEGWGAGVGNRSVYEGNCNTEVLPGRNNQCNLVMG